MWYWQAFFVTAVASTLAVAAGVYVIARDDPRARPWALLAALSALALPVSIVLHNALSALTGGEEAVSFLVALIVAPVGFGVGAVGSGVVSLRREPTLGRAILIAAAGMTLFAAYALFALTVTTIEGGNPPYQASIEAVVLPVAALAMIGGATAVVFNLVFRRRSVSTTRVG